jgi:type III restriction enzyme
MKIQYYLIQNGYTGYDGTVTDAYRSDLGNATLAALPDELAEYADGIHTFIQGVFDENVLAGMVEDANKTTIPENKLNDNFYKTEFQALWDLINHKYAYTVEFDSNELTEKSIAQLNEKMLVTQLQYVATTAEQKSVIKEDELARYDSFSATKTTTKKLDHAQKSQIKYDLVGKIAEGTTLTRKTVVKILQGLEKHIFAMFKHNPEEFISKAIKLIKEQKATMIVEHITYNEIEGKYESDIFTAEKHNQGLDKAFKADKHIQDYVYTDGTAEKSVERRFAESLDGANEVCVYAKLPKGFAIPTPVCNYSPDWAIAFFEGKVKHVYFIAETKGSMSSMDLRPLEKAKIDCASRLFNELSTSKVKYHEVDSYQSLMDVMANI